MFRPACTCDMSVLDVLVHTMGVRAAIIRFDKLKESENHAVMSVYSDYFLIPIMTSHLKIRRPVRRRKGRRPNWRRLKRPCGHVSV